MDPKKWIQESDPKFLDSGSFRIIDPHIAILARDPHGSQIHPPFSTTGPLGSHTPYKILAKDRRRSFNRLHRGDTSYYFEVEVAPLMPNFVTLILSLHPQCFWMFMDSSSCETIFFLAKPKHLVKSVKHVLLGQSYLHSWWSATAHPTRLSFGIHNY